MTPNPIPAVIMRARRKVIGHLNRVGATTPNRAVTYIPTRRHDRQGLAYLQRRGVVTLTQDGRLWLDEEKAAELRQATRTRMAVIFGGAIAAAAAVFAFTR
jgi:hypothetical protein